MDENNLVTLKLIGFNELESSNLTAILALAERALQKNWQVVDSMAADFFLLSVASTAQLDSNSFLKTLPLERCLFYTNDATQVNSKTLLVHENPIPSLRSLVALFNQLSLSMAASQPLTLPEASEVTPITVHSAEPVPEQPVENKDYFDPQQGLLGYLLQPKEHHLVITLTHPIDCLALYVDKEKHVYYSHNTLEQLDTYLLASRDALSVKSYTVEAFNNGVNAEHLLPHPLKNLIWYAAMTLSAGKVMQGYTQEKIVTLKSWPDLRLPKCLNYAKALLFMKNNAATLPVIAEQTALPLTDLYTLYNACYLIGLIEYRDELAIQKKQPPLERLELFAKINARLNP